MRFAGSVMIGIGMLGRAELAFVVLDIAYIQNANNVRRPPGQQKPPGTGCPVNTLRDHSAVKDGIRECIPVDPRNSFPKLELRPEATGTGTNKRFYHVSVSGLQSDIYNPIYFNDRTACRRVAELKPKRKCFKEIYTIRPRNNSSKIKNAAIAFWTTQFENRVPDAGGVAARSAVWGFHPVYFKPEQVKPAMDIILFDEWKLPKL